MCSDRLSNVVACNLCVDDTYVDHPPNCNNCVNFMDLGVSHKDGVVDNTLNSTQSLEI